MSKKKLTPYIVCTGANGRCVQYGLCATEPVPGQPVRLEQARMIVYWCNSRLGPGLHRLASHGPESGDKITHAVPMTMAAVVQEVLALTPAAATAWASL